MLEPENWESAVAEPARQPPDEEHWRTSRHWHPREAKKLRDIARDDEDIALNGLHFEILNSLAQLRAVAADWDALWQRSGLALPTARAELVAQWVEHFAPHAPFRAVLVRDDQTRLLGALPLCGRGLRWAAVGTLPGNAWSPAGQLLVDQQIDGDSVCDTLLAACRQLGWPLLALNGVLADQPAWQALRAATERAGMKLDARRRFDIDRVTLADDWPTYLASRSGTLRRQMRRKNTQAELAGPTSLRVIEPSSADELAVWLRRGFEIEDRGWKGRADSSVRRSPGMFEFYLEQATQLAEWGQLRLVFLEHRGQPIAFEYGWVSQGVYFSPKVGYDEAFARFSPGQLLRSRLFEQFHAEGSTAEGSIAEVDFLGPSSRATACWSTASYPVERWLLACNPLGRLMLSSLQHARPLLRRLRSAAPATLQEPAAPASAVDAEALEEVGA